MGQSTSPCLESLDPATSVELSLRAVRLLLSDSARMPRRRSVPTAAAKVTHETTTTTPAPRILIAAGGGEDDEAWYTAARISETATATTYRVRRRTAVAAVVAVLLAIVGTRAITHRSQPHDTDALPAVGRFQPMGDGERQRLLRDRDRAVVARLLAEARLRTLRVLLFERTEAAPKPSAPAATPTIHARTPRAAAPTPDRPPPPFTPPFTPSCPTDVPWC
jgi:hypothetical protein